MKSIFLIAAAMMISATSFAYDASEGRVQFYCTAGNPFVSGLSTRYSFKFRSNNVVEGFFAGKPFSFVAKKPSRGKNRIVAFADAASGIMIQYQTPHPYDGLQDRVWGEISKGTAKKTVNCYRAE